MGGKQCIKVWTITYKEISLKKTKKQDRTIKESELKKNRHNWPIQKSELKTKKQDRTIKESELKSNRHNRPIQKSELGINRLYRPIQSEDRIGIGRSINRTYRPPLPMREKIKTEGEKIKTQKGKYHKFSPNWNTQILSQKKIVSTGKNIIWFPSCHIFPPVHRLWK